MIKIDYKLAGVDVEAGNESVNLIKNKVQATCGSHILSKIGGFAAMIDLGVVLKNYKNPVLVQSIDGVGTKVIIARMMNRYDTLGHDLLSSSANDILVVGAKPITMLDYIASDKLNPQIIDKLVSGMCEACIENDVALVGGETAEMPDVYLSGENDLVGIVTGVVEKDKIVTGQDVIPNDIILGFSSSGLHTNGYSLARKLFFDVGGFSVFDKYPGINKTIGETLLEPHINYTKPILNLLSNNIKIKGMVHVTGGGFTDNIPRVLPKQCSAEINLNSWNVLPVFNALQELGNLEQEDMYKTFNMGIGYMLIVSESEVKKVMDLMKEFPGYNISVIGKIIGGKREVIYV